MASNIKFKRSAVQNRVPTTAQLELGELALNTYDGKLYTEKNSGSAAVVEIGSILSSLVVDGDNGGGNGDVTFHGATASRDLLWDASANSLIAKDNTKLTVGDGTDLSIYHENSSTTNWIEGAGLIRLQTSSGNIEICPKNGAEKGARFVTDGAAELYHNGAKVLETGVNQLVLTGNASECNIFCKTSDGTTRGILGVTNSSSVTLYSGSSTKALEYTSNVLSLYHAGTKQCETHSEGFTIKGGNTSSVTRLRINGNEGQDAHILMSADDGDDNADHWRLRNIASDNSFDLVSYASGSYQSVLKGTSSRALELHYQGTKVADTQSVGLKVYGTSGRTTYNNGSTEGYIGFNGAGNFTLGAASLPTELQAGGANYLTLSTNSAERVRIESNGDVAINITDGDFGQTNASSNFAKGDTKLGVLGSVSIANFSTTAADFSQLSFYRRHGATAGANGRLQSTHNLGRISWNGSSNDTSFPDEVCAIQAVATGGDWWAASARRATLQFHQYHGEALRIVNSNTQSYTGGSADNRYAEVQVRHKTPYSTDGGYPGGTQSSTNQINFSIYNEHYGGNRLAFRSGGVSQFELETKTRDVNSGSYNDADVYFRSQFDGSLTDRYVIGTHGGHTFKSRSKTTLGVGSGGDIWFGENPYNSQWSATNAGGWYYREDETSMIVASRAHTGYSTFYINKNTGGGSSDTRWIDFYWNANQYG